MKAYEGEEVESTNFLSSRCLAWQYLLFYFGLRKTRYEGIGEDYITRRFVICAPYQ